MLAHAQECHVPQGRTGWDCVFVPFFEALNQLIIHIVAGQPIQLNHIGLVNQTHHPEPQVKGKRTSDGGIGKMFHFHVATQATLTQPELGVGNVIETRFAGPDLAFLNYS